MVSRKELLQRWERHFLEKNIDSPRLSAQILLAHVLGAERLVMLLEPLEAVPARVLDEFETLAQRRLLGEPVAYLVGSKEFYGLDFVVSPDVLIPRPETEGLVDIVRESFADDATPFILDIGTGSGVLAVTCAYFLPRSRIVAVERFRPTLEVARINADRHNVSSRVLFVQADLVGACNLSNADLILANLPYVPEGYRATMSPEVLGYEPEVALFGGADGLDCYRALRCGLYKPKSGARLLCEMDCSQGAAMRELFAPLARQIEILPDAAGRERYASVVF